MPAVLSSNLNPFAQIHSYNGSLPPATPYWTEQISQDVYLKVLSSWMSDNATTLLEEHYTPIGITTSNVRFTVSAVSDG